jgi:hypothetical protein
VNREDFLNVLALWREFSTFAVYKDLRHATLMCVGMLRFVGDWHQELIHFLALRIVCRFDSVEWKNYNDTAQHLSFEALFREQMQHFNSYFATDSIISNVYHFGRVLFLHFGSLVMECREEYRKELLQAMSVYDHVFEGIQTSLVLFLCILRFEVKVGRDMVTLIGKKVFESRNDPAKYGWFNKSHLYVAKDVSGEPDYAFNFDVELGS